MEKKRILIALLDWGLGHAARCIPVINELVRQNADVIMAADGRPYDLLRKEFPQLHVIRFPGYSIQYSGKENLLWKILKQLPSFLNSFVTEHKFLEQIIKELQIDAVISDSRYGVFSKSVPSVFLIHQLRILLPRGLSWCEPIIALLNRRRINKFSECWIPDYDNKQNLSGRLSHNTPLPKNCHYIGALSRIKNIPEIKKELDILVILSGPEPQRALFEDILIEQLKKTSYHSFIVRGIPEKSIRIKLSDTITAISSVQSDELSRLIAASQIIIARSGYSTIMDLSFVGAKAIFVPTPQQTEQEYLAKSLKEKMICYSETQADFQLERAMDESKKYSGFHIQAHDMSALKQRIEHLLTGLDTKYQ